MKRSLVAWLQHLAPPLVVALLFVAAWHFAVTWGGVGRYLLPSPGKVAASARTNLEELASAAGRTAAAAALGFLASLTLGSLTAFAFSQSALARRGLFPYAVFLQTVPIVAIAPLVIVWCGYGFRSVVLISAILGLFPIITSATTGLTRIDPNLRDLFTVCRASRLAVLWKLRLPHAAPYLVTGAKVACGLNVVGAIVGEFFVSYGVGQGGLGRLLLVTSNTQDLPKQYATVICCTLLSLTMFAVVSLIGSLAVRRWGGPTVEK